MRRLWAGQRLRAGEDQRSGGRRPRLRGGTKRRGAVSVRGWQGWALPLSEVRGLGEGLRALPAPAPRCASFGLRPSGLFSRGAPEGGGVA